MKSLLHSFGKLRPTTVKKVTISDIVSCVTVIFHIDSKQTTNELVPRLRKLFEYQDLFKLIINHECFNDEICIALEPLFYLYLDCLDLAYFNRPFIFTHTIFHNDSKLKTKVEVLSYENYLMHLNTSKTDVMPISCEMYMKISQAECTSFYSLQQKVDTLSKEHMDAYIEIKGKLDNDYYLENVSYCEFLIRSEATFYRIVNVWYARWKKGTLWKRFFTNHD
jgi:hypothetical protein